MKSIVFIHLALLLIFGSLDVLGAERSGRVMTVECPVRNDQGSWLIAPNLTFDTSNDFELFRNYINIWIDGNLGVSGSEDDARWAVNFYNDVGYLLCYYNDQSEIQIRLHDCLFGIYDLSYLDAEMNGRHWGGANRGWAVVVKPDPGQSCDDVLVTRSDADMPLRPGIYEDEGLPLKRHDCPPVRFEAPAARLIGYDTREVLPDGSTRPGPQPLGNVLDLGSGLEFQIRRDVFEATFGDVVPRFDLLCRYDDGVELAIPVQSGLWGVFGLARHPPTGAPAGTSVVFERAWALSWTRTWDWPR